MLIMLKMLIMDGFTVQTQRKNPGRNIQKAMVTRHCIQGLPITAGRVGARGSASYASVYRSRFSKHTLRLLSA
jgi:hypothetical protein